MHFFILFCCLLKINAYICKNKTTKKTKQHENRVEVIENKTEKTVYIFSVHENNIVFVEYGKRTKPEGKRIWQYRELFNVKCRERDNKVNNIVVPDSVKLEALKSFVETIKVLEWNEWRNIKNKITT